MQTLEFSCDLWVMASIPRDSSLIYRMGLLTPMSEVVMRIQLDDVSNVLRIVASIQ
jgi:hypothetical protein